MGGKSRFGWGERLTCACVVLVGRRCGLTRGKRFLWFGGEVKGDFGLKEEEIRGAIGSSTGVVARSG